MSRHRIDLVKLVIVLPISLVLISHNTNHIAKADTLDPNYPALQLQDETYQPSLGVVIGILGIMFVITIIILIYAKMCHATDNRPISGLNNGLNSGRVVGPGQLSRRFSGIDKTVVESLPFFRFSSLKGSREGLECSVCLSKFEDVEVLRLLPKCRHAFHIGCIDKWLENHSSCPLCRHRITAEDLRLVAYSNSLRFLGFREDSIRVTREEDEEENNEVVLHKHNHRIVVVSGFAFNNRWSDLRSSDLLSLNSEMMRDESSEKKKKIFDEFDNNKQRSASEITAVSRYGDDCFYDVEIGNSKNKNNEECSSSDKIDDRKRNVNERVRKVWLPIATRTIQWFATKESRNNKDTTSTTSL